MAPIATPMATPMVAMAPIAPIATPIAKPLSKKAHCKTWLPSPWGEHLARWLELGNPKQQLRQCQACQANEGRAWHQGRGGSPR
eukprot:1158346-Pelagomonas_calceolata.AAC.5